MDNKIYKRHLADLNNNLCVAFNAVQNKEVAAIDCTHVTILEMELFSQWCYEKGWHLINLNHGSFGATEKRYRYTRSGSNNVTPRELIEMYLAEQ